MPYFDREFGEELYHVFKEKFDLLLRHKTYEIFRRVLPYYDDASHAASPRPGGVNEFLEEVWDRV